MCLGQTHWNVVYCRRPAADHEPAVAKGSSPRKASIYFLTDNSLLMVLWSRALLLQAVNSGFMAIVKLPSSADITL